MDPYRVNEETERLLPGGIPEEAPPPYSVLPPEGVGSIQQNVSQSTQHNAQSQEPDGGIDKTEGVITKVYKKRWYILTMYCCMAMTQGGVWNTWGPVAASSKVVFGWQDSDIALLTNWGPITYIVSIIFFTWLMDVKGLRWSSLVTSGLVFVGCGLRCITAYNPAATWLIHSGQILNGLGGPVAMGAPPLLSAVWFPANERTTATALSCVLNGVGVALSFIIGPLIVEMPKYCNATAFSNISNTSGHTLHNSSQDGNITKYCCNIPEMRNQIMYMMYGEFGWIALVTLAIFVYFPTRPKLPPSISASLVRLDYKQGLITLLKSRKFWMLGIPYSLSSGVLSCWSSVLDVNLSPFNITEVTAGYMGFFSTMAGTVTGLVVSRFADFLSRRMKLFLLVLYTIAVGMFTWFAIICQRLIPLSVPSLYISVIAGNAVIGGATPLFFELTCESCYPVAEGLTNGFLTWLNNIAGLIFLLIMMLKPYIGVAWTNWCAMGSILVCLPIIAAFKEVYKRLDIDTKQTDVSGHSDQNQVEPHTPVVT